MLVQLLSLIYDVAYVRLKQSILFVYLAVTPSVVSVLLDYYTIIRCRNVVLHFKQQLCFPIAFIVSKRNHFIMQKYNTNITMITGQNVLYLHSINLILITS